MRFVTPQDRSADDGDNDAGTRVGQLAGDATGLNEPLDTSGNAQEAQDDPAK